MKLAGLGPIGQEIKVVVTDDGYLDLRGVSTVDVGTVPAGVQPRPYARSSAHADRLANLSAPPRSRAAAQRATPAGPPSRHTAGVGSRRACGPSGGGNRGSGSRCRGPAHAGSTAVR